MSFGKTVNLGNSIIGVSILAMPYCFVQSGLLLSIVLIVLSGFFTRLSCHFLLKSAFLSRRRSFELMVQDVLGSTGRILVEVGLIGFLLGTCVAYFIMIGDLAPKILTDLTELKYDQNLRVISVVVLSIFVALPLSLLKQVDSLTSLSVLSMTLYSCLILKLMFETTEKLSLEEITHDKFDKISYWNISGLLTTFPIFSMAMSCQTSLFEIFDNSVINSDLDTMKRDNSIIKKAIYLCSIVYIVVGLLGYLAFHEQTLYGNILLAFPPSLTTTLTKFGFIVSLLLSFPLCLFPCRTSVYSLTIGKMRTTINFQPLPTGPPSSVTLVGVSDANDCENNYAPQKDSHCDNDTNNNRNSIDKNHSNVMRVSHNNTFLTMDSKMNTKPLNNFRLNSMLSNGNGSTYSYRKLLDEDELWSPQIDVGSAGQQVVGADSYAVSTNEGAAQSISKLHMSDYHFKLLTVILIIVTVILSLMFPHIEFILGIIGSTAGTTVCFVLPAYTFICIGQHTKAELYLARLLLSVGLAMLVFCTYSTIHSASSSSASPKS